MEPRMGRHPADGWAKRSCEWCAHAFGDCAPTCKAWVEYDGAAEYLAVRGLKGNIGDPLPVLMSAQAVALIDADTEAFAAHVRAHAYAISMRGVPTDDPAA